MDFGTPEFQRDITQWSFLPDIREGYHHEEVIGIMLYRQEFLRHLMDEVQPNEELTKGGKRRRSRDNGMIGTGGWFGHGGHPPGPWAGSKRKISRRRGLA